MSLRDSLPNLRFADNSRNYLGISVMKVSHKNCERRYHESTSGVMGYDQEAKASSIWIYDCRYAYRNLLPSADCPCRSRHDDA